MRLIKTFGAVLVAGLLFAGCGGANDDDAASDEADAPVAEEIIEESGGDSAGSASGGTISAASIDPAPRHVIYTLDLVIETDDVARAAARAAVLAERSGGFVAQESMEGTERATLTLRIPSARHTTILSELERLGEVEDRNRIAEDVSEEVVDIKARVASQRRSIARIRELLDQATELADVVRIESELAHRESDLDSLLTRQEQLSSLTTLATITVTFYEADGPSGDGPKALGFVSGLRGGWDAFIATVSVVGTVAGAVLPFAAAAAVIGLPVWLVWRRRRSGPTGPVEPPPAPVPAQPGA
ncbi:MAG TPA: DUF4349 domain-containing protein [Jiangellaceae bacterium]|nr:DUF4349 domain-containing protein [Jiangellaceae bacterium]